MNSSDESATLRTRVEIPKSLLSLLARKDDVHDSHDDGSCDVHESYDDGDVNDSHDDGSCDVHESHDDGSCEFIYKYH